MKRPKHYEVISFEGDYAVPGQPNWGKEFTNVSGAIEAARRQHKRLKVKRSEAFHTDVCSQEGMNVHFTIHKGMEYRGKAAQELSDQLAEQ